MSNFIRPMSESVEASIEKLRQLTQVNLQSSWRLWDGGGIVLNEKGHIAWPAGRQVLQLSQRLQIPNSLNGYPLAGLSLRLALTWWAQEAQIFVNNQCVAQGDLFDCSVRLLLTPAVRVGEEFLITLQLVSPGHDPGALVRSGLIYEAANLQHLDPGFVADELEVLQKFTKFENSQYLPKNTIANSGAVVKQKDLESAVQLIDWAALPNRDQFEQSLMAVRQNLLKLEPSKSATDLRIDCGKSASIAQNQIDLLGHAHLDLAWLWPVSETWEVAQRTFESVLNLQQDFPALIFGQTTPALYAWIEQQRPDLFKAIQEQVAAGRWEIVGGTWVEPDVNLVAGESLVRQVLYGQRYIKEKFGEWMRVVWLPDTFGFCWQLPQIFQQGGLDYFVTQKLRWNDTTEFPYGVFWWQSPDGSQILSWMSPPIGENIEPVKMVNYAVEWQQQTALNTAFWLPGVGDHGGGPTREMLEVAQRWQQSPFFPQLRFTKAVDYLSAIKAELLTQDISSNSAGTIPIWNDELYLEFHRGCYTTHAGQKRHNRNCETLLYQAELFAAWATRLTDSPYPKAALEQAWKQVLFNQFHDILPGSAIASVYAMANQGWAAVKQVGAEILAQSLDTLVSQIQLPTPPHPDAQAVILFNSVNWSRSEVVTVPLPLSSGGNWQIDDASGQRLASQISANQESLRFLAQDVPALGYRVFWLYPDSLTVDNLKVDKLSPQPIPDTVPEKVTFGKTEDLAGKDWVLETQLIRVKIAGETGNLVSVYDKLNQRECLDERGGNQLQAFQDQGQYWDAWNIDPNYANYPLPAAQLKEIRWIERGEIYQQLRVVRSLGNSEFCQDYIVQADSPLLTIKTVVDWQERHVLVKATFGLKVDADFATYEIPCGAIQRPTKPQTAAEKAKWEVPALQWADLSEPGYGISLLNDSKYGYDATPNQLRLTLLRGSTWPDETADLGHHEFTYALYPHHGSWQKAQTVRRGYELNQPLFVRMRPGQETTAGKLGPVGQLLNLSADNLVVMAFKQSEDQEKFWILRCYECCGEEARLEFSSDLGLQIVQGVDLLERPGKAGAEFTPRISPWKIASFLIQ